MNIIGFNRLSSHFWNLTKTSNVLNLIKEGHLKAPKIQTDSFVI